MGGGRKVHLKISCSSFVDYIVFLMFFILKQYQEKYISIDNLLIIFNCNPWSTIGWNKKNHKHISCQTIDLWFQYIYKIVNIDNKKILLFHMCKCVEIVCKYNCYIHTIYIYNLACLSVCLYPITSKRLNRSGPNFLWDITWPQGRFMNYKKNFKNVF